MLAFESEKTMFEIYRDTAYSGKFRVVYFTELQDHDKDREISHAFSGEHLFDGYLRNYGKDEAKRVIEKLLERLNAGEAIGAAEIRSALAQYLA